MINALMYVEKLEETGFTSEQAKISVSTWLELMNDNLASKNDLKEESLKLRIAMEKMERRIIVKFGIVIGGSATLFATIIGIFMAVGKFL